MPTRREGRLRLRCSAAVERRDEVAYRASLGYARSAEEQRRVAQTDAADDPFLEARDGGGSREEARRDALVGSHNDGMDGSNKALQAEFLQS